MQDGNTEIFFGNINSTHDAPANMQCMQPKDFVKLHVLQHKLHDCPELNDEMLLALSRLKTIVQNESNDIRIADALSEIRSQKARGNFI